MDVPAEISFTNVDSAPEIEARIHERVARLEKIFDRLITCRVAVSQPHKHHQQGNIPHIRIEMSVPGHEELVVSQEPHHVDRKFADPDLNNVVNEAFKTAERRLKAFKERMRDNSRPSTEKTI